MSINNPLNLLNLSNGTYFIRTSDTQNPYLGIRGLDDIVSKGVFSFLINGSSYLQQGTDIQFEAIDSDGNQISINGVRNLLKGTSRVISFEIDDRISNGEGTLYISANLDSYLENGVETDIPTTFQNTSNFLFEYKFQIDKTRVNTDEIIFRKPPILTVTPSLKTVRDITKTSTTTSTLSGDVKQYYYDESTSSYTILIESASGTYSFDMNGGIATITNSLGLTIQGIVNVVDSSTIFTTIQNPDIEVYSKEEFKGILSSPLSFTISYITIPDISEVRLQETAVATIDIKDMGVVSGDVAKIKVFGKSDSLNSNYVLLSELDVENKNLLELEGTGSVGIFDTSKKVGAWSVSKEQVSATNPTIVSNDDIFLSGLVINGDYDSPTTVEINGRTLQTPRYVLESDIDLDVKKNIDYNLRLNAAVSDVSASDTRLDVYFKSTSIKSDNKFGKLIHSFRADSDKIWRDQFSIVFSVDSDVTDGELVFTTTSGRWYVQDIRLTADVQDGFSPQEFRTEIPLNISKPNQDIDFKVEFFDANNNKADKVLTKDNIIFERPNIVVEGGKNVTVGEMYLGEGSNSGVVTGGSGNGGIVKSFGYQGFAEARGVGGTAGFLMYSGSVLTGSATTYQGVGLELVASSESFFRYRTNPSELDIRTNKFFIGQETTQFISGAESNIEISSSLFHLDPKNNLLVIGTDAIINADLTVNEIRTPALIGGSPSTTANASSSINSDGFAKFVSASIGGFAVLETQINSTNDNLVLKSNGQITGSTVLFDGGTIGGFSLSGDGISGDGYLISGSATGDDFFISASNFNVKANGNITGSQVLFTGGKITGSNITFDVTQFVAKGDTVEISGSNFHLLEGNITASNVDLTGNISAQTGNIGNFQIIDGKISGSNITLDANNSTIFKTDQGPGSDPQSPGFEYLADEYYIDFTPTEENPDNFFVKFGPNFMVDRDGILIASGATFQGTITASAGKLGGFNIGTSSLSSDGDTIFISGSPTLTGFFISSSNFNVKGNGDITGSNVLFTGGKITGSNITFDVTEFVAKGDNVEISGSNFHLLEGNITASNVDLSGTITATAGEIGGFVIESDEIRDTGNNLRLKSSGQITGSQVLFTGGDIGGFVLESDEIRDSGNNLRLKSSGEITGSQVLFTGGTVGGFTITDNLITASNLEINSDGTIQTPNFADGVRGFQITAAGNGSAQFENVKIRGTLRTTVFEKETVNAVGGQLWVANSTVLSQSVTSGETTMSVENVTGFEVNEILLIKKVDGTGFSSEYVLVESSSRTDGASDTNLSGELYVERAYADGLPTGSDVTWVTELASSAQNYSDGQVVVSTGKEDTGWILLNASPNNTYTPYIDIVERTGSGVYDYELKARLGDLSGLSTTRLLGNNPATAGFGLYSENVFLEGGIRATFGEIGGFSITDTAISSSNDNLILRSNGQITGSAFLLGDITKTGNYIEYDGGNLVVNGTINIVGGNAATTDYVNTVSQSLTSSITTVSSSAASDLTSTSQSIDGTITNVSSSIDTTITNVSSSLSSSLSDASSSLASDLTSTSSSLAGDLTSTSSSLSSDIVTNASKIVTDANAKIVKPIPTPSAGAGLYLTSTEMGFYNNSDFTAFISSSGDFLFKKDDDNLVSFGNDSFILNVSDQATISGSQINLLTPTFFFGTDTTGQVNYISGSNGNLEISSSNFVIDESGNVTVSGDITITSGDLAGVTTTSISGSFTEVSESIDNTITTNSSSIATDLTTTSSSIDTTITNVSSSAASDLTSTSQSIDNTITNVSSSVAGDITTNKTNISTNTSDISTNSNKIVTDANAKIVKPIVTPSSTGLFLTAQHLGYYSTVDDWSAYISASGEFLFKADENNLVSFADDGFVLKTETATISGSEINLVTPTFFFGTDTPGSVNYISGSNNNLEISSSNFVLAQNGDVSITGDITSSAALIQGNSTIAGFDVTNTQISDVGGSTLLLKSNGQITASAAQISGNITINNPGDINTGDLNNNAGFTDDTAADAAQADATDAQDRVSNYETQVVLDTNGMSLKNQAGTITLASYGTTTTIGQDANDQSRIFIDNNSVDLIVDTGGTDVVEASFGATTTIGGTSGQHISIDSDSFDVKTDASTTIASFGATTTIGTASAQHVSIDSDSFDIKTDASTTVATFGANTTLTGGTITLRNTTNNNDKVVISENSFQVFDNNNVVASFGANTVLEGGTVTIRNTTNNNDKIEIGENYFRVFDNGTEVAEFGSTTTIGDTTTEHVEITSEGLKLKDGGTERLVMDENGITIGTEVTISATGDATFGGTLSAPSGDIGGFTIGDNVLSNGTTFGISGSATGNEFFISASTFNVKANGDVTGSSVLFDGGKLGGFVISDTQINNSSGTDLILKSDGQITASAAQITGDITANSGQIGGFTIGDNVLSNGTTFGISGSSTGDEFFISSSTFNVKANGNLTASNAQISGEINASSGDIAGWAIDSSTISKLGGSGEGITLDSTNEVIKVTTSAPTDVVKIGKLTSTPTYGIEVLTNVFGSRIFHVEETTGSLAGFEFSSTQINDTGDNLILKSNGQITGSAVQIKGSSEIAGFTVTDTQINDTGNNLILKSNGQITASAAQITGDITATSGELQTLDISGTLTIGTGGTIVNDTVTITNDEIKLNTLGTAGASEPNLSLSGSALQVGDDTFGFKGLLYAWADNFATDGIYLDTVNSTGTFVGKLKLRSPQIQLSSSLETFVDTPVFTVTGDITGSGLQLTGISTDNGETYAVMIDNSTGVVSKRELGSNAFNSDTIGTTTNALTIGTGLDLNSGTTFDGSVAKTISLALGERTDNPTTSNAVLTNDGDGTITAETSLTYDGTSLTNDGPYIVDRPSNTNFTIFSATDSNDYGIQMGLNGNGNLYMAPKTGSGNVFFDNFLYNSGSSGNGNVGSWQVRTGLEVGDVTTTPARGEIRATGDIIAFNSSDERLKENIYKLTGSLDQLDKIEGVSFDWKEFDGKQQIHSNTGNDIGVIAQQVEKVLPQVVQTRENGFKAVRYEKLVPLLIEGIKELRQENTLLKQELTDLKEKINELL